MKYKNLGIIPREEEIKNRVGGDFFPAFDCAGIIQNVDFSVKIKRNYSETEQYLLWAEAKKDATDIITMLAQLILTIGKARTFDKILPPPFLGCFDCQKIAFIPYYEIQEIFYINDFNWNVTPSNRETREFKLIREKISKLDESKIFIFDFEKDEKELKNFIKENFIAGKIKTSKIRIDKNNFINIYNKWLEIVKPTIMLLNWEKAKKSGIIDGDFYLADLLSSENQTLKEMLFVVLNKTKYELNKHENELGIFTSSIVDFSDNQKAHNKFWAIYERPPKEEYWEYITSRRDLLVPQDVRERKGSFYTPKIWVELSQKYIADVFGENWQDEYFVWDCAAGTGNLLAGLTNKYNIWASTIDKADVDVMHDRIENGANLLHEHVFQFDFLNDDFEKLPQDLLRIIKDENKCKKLIIYINPPYAENTSYGEKSKSGVSKSKAYEKYKILIGNGINEVFTQFFTRIYKEIQRCKIANFAKLKALNASNFVKFREIFLAKLEKLFVCPSYTFDNVNGKFPIGFYIWDTNKKEKFERVTSDVYNNYGKIIGTKNFFAVEKGNFIIDWLRKYFDKKTEKIGYLRIQGTDFQTNNTIVVASQPTENDIRESKITEITINNITCCSNYFTVRKVIPADWLNDRDQFLFPNDKWEKDEDFQNDCLAFTLFHNSNNISWKHGVNNWIPFTEQEVNAQNKFESSFMTDFIKGKLKSEKTENEMFENQKNLKNSPLIFSDEAKNVFDAGRELWKYYHSKPKVNVNASFYDIREYFQGRNDAGRMNPKSDDEEYMKILGNLREKMKILAKKIEPKVYEYGFLRK